MDVIGLPLVLIISLLLPVGFVLGYAARSMVSHLRRQPEDSWFVSD
jgi:hypothetical protein